MRLFYLEKAPYIDQVGTLHAVYIGLCQHNSELELQKGTSNASNKSSNIIHNKKEKENEKDKVHHTGSSILRYLFSNAKSSTLLL